MCGIAGFIGPDPVAASRNVATMLHRLRHRGPDGEGTLARWGAAGRNGIVLGHRRLSIIDRTSAAAQPMTSADGRLHLVLNGEIYNYVELRRELETLGRRFRTRSDTEVLLEAWSAWGSAALDRVVGMFAFALLDEPIRAVVLARDPFAIKPLYYAFPAAGQLAFASEIPALLELPGVGRSADSGPLADFLTRGVNTHEGRTMFADIRELPGAQVVVVSIDEPTAIRPACYWRAPSVVTQRAPFATAAEQLRSVLQESVAMHLRSDVPVGLMLSGGLDSSSLLALARRSLGHGAALHTFSYRGDGGSFDEGPWIEAARVAAQAVGHEVRLGPEECVADLPDLVASQGEPFSSPVIFAQRHLFARAAAAGITVLLEGHGADELLAGYKRYRAARLASLLHTRRIAAFLRTSRAFAAAGSPWRALLKGAVALRWPGLRSLPGIRRPERAPLLDPAWLVGSGVALSRTWQPTGPEVLREALSASLHTPSIPWLMRYSDRNAMAFSLENRLPFLNRRVVDFVLQLPEEFFIDDDGRGKRLLRSAMGGLVPDVILERRERVGFDVPVQQWLTHGPGLAGLLAEAMSLPAVARGHAARLLTAVQDRRELPRDRALEAWRLITLAAWSRAFDVSYR